MNEVDHRAVLSVRGETHRDVAPDQVSIYWSVSTVDEGKSAAMAAVNRMLGEVAAGLSALHGRVLTADTVRAPLTWSTPSIHTEREYSHDKVPGQHGPTGRHHAAANCIAFVRDFGLLDEVEAVLTRQDTTDIHSVQWSVDRDNAAWAQVRADAIQAALLKGRDYAAALGGSVVSVDHIADAGLLSGERSAFARAASTEAAVALSSGDGDGTSMTPVPQTLTAVIEARLTALVVPPPDN